MNGQLLRHTTPWLLLEEVSPGIVAQLRLGFSTTNKEWRGASREMFAQLYGTQEYVLACVVTSVDGVSVGTSFPHRLALR